MRSFRVAATLMLLSIPVVLAAERPLRFGSLAPANSLWDKALKQMAVEWDRATDGRVRLRVSSMGQGNESTIIRRLKLNTTQVAGLTPPGLGEIDEVFNVMTLPFFFESDAETRHVLKALRPRFERALRAQGLVLINWAHTGWAHMFTADPVTNLQELKRTKLFTSAGDDRMVQWYKRNGFDPVPLELSDVMMGLHTGLINAYPLPPYAVMLLQYYRQAPHMLDLPLGPVVSATVMTTRAWEGISVQDRQAILASGKKLEEALWVDVPRQDAQAVQEMKKRGLTVMGLDGAAVSEFRRAADELTTTQRGWMVPADVYDLAVRERNNFRGR